MIGRLQRAVEEARERIERSPELQKQQQQIERPGFYRQAISGQPDLENMEIPKYFNTIYTPSGAAPDAFQPGTGSVPMLPNPLPLPPINYRDIKAHYLSKEDGHRKRKHHKRSVAPMINQGDGGSEGSSGRDTHSDGPPAKRRKFNPPGLGAVEMRSMSPRKSAQSTRESDKDTVYPLSSEFQEIMGRERASWRQCWKWTMDHAKEHNLREGNRKIRCDAVLQKVFSREESSVSGVSRLIWKHLIGAMDLDENGRFKKLVYKKRKGTKRDEASGSSSSYGTEEEKEGAAKGELSQVEIDSSFGYFSESKEMDRYNNHFGFKYKGTKDEEPSRPKRRYRRRFVRALTLSLSLSLCIMSIRAARSWPPSILWCDQAAGCRREHN